MTSDRRIALKRAGTCPRCGTEGIELGKRRYIEPGSHDCDRPEAGTALLTEQLAKLEEPFDARILCLEAVGIEVLLGRYRAMQLEALGRLHLAHNATSSEDRTVGTELAKGLGLGFAQEMEVAIQAWLRWAGSYFPEVSADDPNIWRAEHKLAKREGIKLMPECVVPEQSSSRIKILSEILECRRIGWDLEDDRQWHHVSSFLGQGLVTWNNTDGLFYPADRSLAVFRRIAAEKKHAAA